MSEYSSDQEGHSANVDMYLLVGGKKLSVGRVGRGYAVLRESADISKCVGTLVIVVDGKPNSYDVGLAEPLTKDTTRIELW